MRFWVIRSRASVVMRKNSCTAIDTVEADHPRASDILEVSSSTCISLFDSRQTLSLQSCSVMPLTPGSKLGHFEITAALGEGGMGEVYRARDEKLGRDVAIKVIRGDALE